MIDGLIETGKKDSVEFNQEQFDTSRDYLLAIIKGLIGRDLFEQATYYRIVNPYNTIFTSAVEIISDPVKYRSYLSPAKEQK